MTKIPKNCQDPQNNVGGHGKDETPCPRKEPKYIIQKEALILRHRIWMFFFW